MLQFYYNLGPNPMKVALFLEEAGLEYEAIPIDTRKGEQFTAEYLSINPNAKAPSLIDGETVLFDSNAILLYLAEKDIYKNVFNLGGAWAPTVWDFACLVQERCKVVLGFEPSLSRLAQEAGKADHNFDYCIDALLQTGFSPEFNRVSEIDQLLDFCQEVSFSPNDN